MNLVIIVGERELDQRSTSGHSCVLASRTTSIDNQQVRPKHDRICSNYTVRLHHVRVVMRIVLLIVFLSIGEIIAARPKRSLGGKLVVIQRAPYFVTIRQNDRHLCSGALITMKHALTAAHCVEHIEAKNVREVRVISGMDEPNMAINPHWVHKVIIPRQYFNRPEWEPLRDDIAVIVLLQKLKSSRREMPIPLSKVEPMYSREATLVAFESGTYPKPDSQLHGLDNVVTPIEFCLPDSPIHIHTYAAMFCTKNEMHYGMSVGDVGAPLVRNGTLIGIASWLARSGNNFDVYMNVHRYEDFIKKATKCMDRFCILV